MLWLLRLLGVFRANRDKQFAEEIGVHLEMHVRDLIESGLSPDEVRRQAIMKLGGVESTRQAYQTPNSFLGWRTCCGIAALRSEHSQKIPASPLWH